jgi:hypothetical protein
MIEKLGTLLDGRLLRKLIGGLSLVATLGSSALAAKESVQGSPVRQEADARHGRPEAPVIPLEFCVVLRGEKPRSEPEASKWAVNFAKSVRAARAEYILAYVRYDKSQKNLSESVFENAEYGVRNDWRLRKDLERLPVELRDSYVTLLAMGDAAQTTLEHCYSDDRNLVIGNVLKMQEVANLYKLNVLADALDGLKIGAPVVHKPSAPVWEQKASPAEKSEIVTSTPAPRSQNVPAPSAAVGEEGNAMHVREIAPGELDKIPVSKEAIAAANHWVTNLLELGFKQEGDSAEMKRLVSGYFGPEVGAKWGTASMEEREKIIAQLARVNDVRHQFVDGAMTKQLPKSWQAAAGVAGQGAATRPETRAVVVIYMMKNDLATVPWMNLPDVDKKAAKDVMDAVDTIVLGGPKGPELEGF